MKEARTLLAVRQFKDGEYLTALRSLADLNVNPAKVLGLFPELVSGRMSVPREKWIVLFGGRSWPANVPSSPKDEQHPSSQEETIEHSESAGAALKGALKSIEGYLPIPGKKVSKDSEELPPESKEDAVKQQIKKTHDGNKYIQD